MAQVIFEEKPVMKKLAPFFILCLIVCLFSAITGCRLAGNTAPQQTQILGKWIMSTATSNITVVNGGNNKDTTRFTPADYFLFKADSTVDILAGGISHNGRWKMANNKIYFTGTNYMDVPSTGWNLAILTATRLEFEDIETTASTNADLKLDLRR